MPSAFRYQTKASDKGIIRALGVMVLYLISRQRHRPLVVRGGKSHLPWVPGVVGTVQNVALCYGWKR